MTFVTRGINDPLLHRILDNNLILSRALGQIDIDKIGRLPT